MEAKRDSTSYHNFWSDRYITEGMWVKHMHSSPDYGATRVWSKIEVVYGIAPSLIMVHFEGEPQETVLKKEHIICVSDKLPPKEAVVSMLADTIFKNTAQSSSQNYQLTGIIFDEFDITPKGGKNDKS